MKYKNLDLKDILLRKFIKLLKIENKTSKLINLVYIIILAEILYYCFKIIISNLQ